jgi:hypothetical protein
LEDAGKNPLTIDSKEPTMKFADYALNEKRYRMLKMANPSSATRYGSLTEGCLEGLEVPPEPVQLP